MLKTDLKRTQHFTTRSAQICENLLEFIPSDASLIEPFAGGEDLIELFPDASWEKYDIEPTNNTIVKRDTLKTPPDYKGKWVITNPPYLAKNKAKDKELFQQYNNLDDLYKISIKTILDSEGGILIIPTNFFTDERSSDIRTEFLNVFNVLKVNIFTTPVFDTTTYSVCSFVFKRKQEVKAEVQSFPVLIHPSKDSLTLALDPDTGYRVAGEFYQKIEAEQSMFSRLLLSNPNVEHITNIKLYAIDTRNERIRLEYEPNLFYGKATDRTYATFVSDVPLTEEQQRKIVDSFNLILNNFRNKYKDISMTNYRDYNRKRIGFDFAYKLATYIAKNII